MPHIIKFRYTFYHNRKLPIIPVTISSSSTKKFNDAWAYVDSGATCSVFRKEEAEWLGIDIFSGERKIVKGIGVSILIYFYKLELKIDEFLIETTIGFSPENQLDFNILGRQDIFENFQVCFNDKKEIVTFQKLVKTFIL